MQQPLVVLDCERMRHPNTGLYHFCWHLAKNLSLRQPSAYRIGLYLPEATGAALNLSLPTVPQHAWHKLYLWPARRAQLWHCTHQGSSYFPVGGRCKTVLTIHDLNFLYDERKSAAKKEQYLRQVKRKLAHADAVVAISEYAKQDLIRHTRIPAERVQVIYNGCNINNSLAPTPPPTIPDRPFFFSIGTILPKKNFHVLPGLLCGNEHLLVIAGVAQNKAYRERIQAVANELGVADRLVFTGPIAESVKYWYLQHCSAFAFPSLSEGFGLPVIEAMHFGKPVLLSRATSLPEVGGPEAFYFDSFEPAHMTQLAARAIDEVRSAEKTAAIRQWAARFSWVDAADAYNNLYRQLLG